MPGRKLSNYLPTGAQNPFLQDPKAVQPASSRSAADSGRNTNVENDYRVVKELRTGGMSLAIKLIQRRATGTLYIKKTIPITLSDGTPDGPRVRAEIRVLERISRDRVRDNLNKMIEFDLQTSNGLCHLVLDYCDKGNLEQTIKDALSRSRYLKESFVWNVLAAGCNALMFLHHGLVDAKTEPDPTWDSILHLDIKPANIFLDSRGGRYGMDRVVLGDFGCAVQASDVLRNIESIEERPGYTPGYCPPEQGRSRYGAHTDLWLLGATVQATCTLEPAPKMELLKTGQPCTSEYSRELNRLVAKLVHQDPTRRTMAYLMVAEAERGLKDAVSKGV